MAYSNSDPLATITANATTVHGSSRRDISDTGTRRIVHPSSRRSNRSANPKNTDIPHT